MRSDRRIGALSGRSVRSGGLSIARVEDHAKYDSMLPESLRSLPYIVHTNRELGLMLAGSKPLAMFSYIDGFEVECVLRYLRIFDRHVVSGRFKKHEKVSILHRFDDRIYHQIFYTLPGQEWRVDAMLELRSMPGPWSNERVRREGTLLGYEDWQNDIWLSRYPVAGNTV